MVARLLEGVRHVAVGAVSPIPGAGSLLASALAEGKIRVSILGSQTHHVWSDTGVEMFDCAAQGRMDAFFLGGGQIDGQGNINLVGVGDYPQSKVRWSGSFGSAFLYFVVPRVILFREEHTRRVLVPRVDFISAPGISDPGIHRPGGPYALLTERCLFSFDRPAGAFVSRARIPDWTSGRGDPATIPASTSIFRKARSRKPRSRPRRRFASSGGTLPPRSRIPIRSSPSESSASRRRDDRPNRFRETPPEGARGSREPGCPR